MQILQNNRLVSTASDPVDVARCDDDPAWDAYVVARDERSLFHRSAWKQVWNVYGLRSFLMAARRRGEIVGVLPLVEQASLVTGRQLVSLPWFDAAGMLADDEQAEQALLQSALRLCDDQKARWIQIRQQKPRALSPSVRTDKVLMQLPLEASSEALWKRLHPKVRNQIRKGEKSDLHVRSGGAELVSAFFNVYSRNMRDLGSPSHSRAFFEVLIDTFSSESRIWLVGCQEQTVGAGLTMANGSTLEIPWASSLKEFNGHCVNHVLYWRILEHACERGFRTFRFGRSSQGSGQHHFKKQWGAEELPLHWYFVSRDPQQAAAAATPPQEHFGWASRLWQKLPLSVSRQIGPRLIAGIP